LENLINNLLEEDPSLIANSLSLGLLWNYKFHYRVYIGPCPKQIKFNPRSRAVFLYDTLSMFPPTSKCIK